MGSTKTTNHLAGLHIEARVAKLTVLAAASNQATGGPAISQQLPSSNIAGHRGRGGKEQQQQQQQEWAQGDASRLPLLRIAVQPVHLHCHYALTHSHPRTVVPRCGVS
jgi:hypothetical protein